MSDKDDKNGDKNNVLPFRNKKGEKINLDDMITFKSSPKTTKEIGEELKKSQTAEFVEGVIDDMAIMLIKNFVDLAMKVDRPSFYADLAILTDIMRGMIYRDFGYEHISQKLVDKMVTIGRDKTGHAVPVVNYSRVLQHEDIKKDHITPITKEEQLELDFNGLGYEDNGPKDVFFTPDIEWPDDPEDDK